MKAYAAHDDAIPPYVASLLGPEDEALAGSRQRGAEAGLPDMAVGPIDTRHLEVLSRSVHPRRVVEVGTLAGTSAIALARGLAPDGHLHTIELEPDHAAVAREAIAAAGLAARVTVHVGAANDVLESLGGEGPFDLAFLDADKRGYPDYLTWCEQHLRVGGLLLADNVFRKPRGREHAESIHAFNLRLVADDGPWRATFLPLEDGLAVAVRLR